MTCTGERPKAGLEPKQIAVCAVIICDPDPKEGDLKDMSRMCLKLHETSSVSGKDCAANKAVTPQSDLRSGVAEDAERPAAIGIASQISLNDSSD